MKYLSVCSGIEAASVAWKDLGWKAEAFSEIEAFPSAVLQHHYKDTPNLGDMTKYESWNINTIDLLVGGTPCQSFSVAGLRQGLKDPRGNLMLTYLAIADRYRPRWLVWENVPGVLSSNGGRDFGTFLGALVELGYGFAYRVLDAQWFGVAQRRRRVFVIGCLGDATSAAKVLFERESVCRNPAPSREKGKGITGNVAPSLTIWRAGDNANAEVCIDHAGTLNCNKGQRGGLIAFDTTQITSKANYSNPKQGDPCHPLASGAHPPAVAIPISTQNAIGRLNGRNDWPLGIFKDGDPAPTLSKSHGHAVCTDISQSTAVRRLTPTECERLQGFPDGYTAIPWKKKSADQCPDGPRYKALGNSMAVPVMRWIGERIDKVNKEIQS
jgi:DNA (cytosine-5)-methyltransferase 1